MVALRQALIVVLCYGVAVAATPFLVLLMQAAFLVGRGEGLGSLFQDLPSFIIMGMLITGMYAAPPFLCAIGILRYLELRSWWSHSILGAPVSYVALGLFNSWVPTIEFLPYWAAGLGAGLVYWLCRRPFGWD